MSFTDVRYDVKKCEQIHMFYILYIFLFVCLKNMDILGMNDRF